MSDHAAVETVYHLITKPQWESFGEVYTPPTYEQDGFVHLTAERADAQRVGNHFCKTVKEDFVLLTVSIPALADVRPLLKWEAAAAVGNTAAHAAGDYPHLYAPLPRAAITATAQIERDADGTFLAIADDVPM